MERKTLIDNDFYDDLEDKWYEADDHPIALLRAENAARTPWVLQKLRDCKKSNSTVLDIGCGAGFLTNALAKEEYKVTGVDLSLSSLAVARKRDETKSVCYMEANAYHLPFAKGSFDVVCAMDFLEHVEEPAQIVQEISRVLKPGGLFFFHTFNRNILSWLIVIKGVEWFVKNTPCHMHLYRMLVKPSELKGYCKKEGLRVLECQGLAPDILTKSFWRLLTTRKVSPSFSFRITSSLMCGYMGCATKTVIAS